MAWPTSAISKRRDNLLLGTACSKNLQELIPAAHESQPLRDLHYEALRQVLELTSLI